MNRAWLPTLILLFFAATVLYAVGNTIPLDHPPAGTPAELAPDGLTAGDCPFDPALLEGRRAAAAPDNVASGKFRKAPEIMIVLHKRLQRRIEERALAVRLSLYDFATGGQIKIGAHEPFNPASMIKTLLLLTVLKKAGQGDISLHESHLLSENDKHVGATPVAGAGVLQFAGNGTDYTVEELLSLMISLSDNVATNILFERLGTRDISDTADRLELEKTAFTRKMYDHHSSLPLNRATAFELTRMLLALENTELFSEELGKKGIRMMLETEDKRIGRYIDGYTHVANKVGTDSGFVGDMALLYFPERAPMALTIAVVEPPDPDEAIDFIGELAALITETMLKLK